MKKNTIKNFMETVAGYEIPFLMGNRMLDMIDSWGIESSEIITKQEDDDFGMEEFIFIPTAEKDRYLLINNTQVFMALVNAYVELVDERSSLYKRFNIDPEKEKYIESKYCRLKKSFDTVVNILRNAGNTDDEIKTNLLYEAIYDEFAPVKDLYIRLQQINIRDTEIKKALRCIENALTEIAVLFNIDEEDYNDYVENYFS